MRQGMCTAWSSWKSQEKGFPPLELQKGMLPCPPNTQPSETGAIFLPTDLKIIKLCCQASKFGVICYSSNSVCYVCIYICMYAMYNMYVYILYTQCIYNAYTHTHTHIYICVCVCVCVCIPFTCMHAQSLKLCLTLQPYGLQPTAPLSTGFSR